MKKILLIGSGAREHALAKSLKASSSEVDLYVLATSHNPGIQNLAVFYEVMDITDNQSVLKSIARKKINLAVIGPEAPLAQGLVDDLEKAGVLCFGPYRSLAAIESSKSFTRNLLAEYGIDASPAYQVFTDFSQANSWLQEFSQEFVIKPDGLTGGKGVKVQGDHFATRQEGLKIIEQLVGSDGQVVVEEKLVGQEFSLMSITDGFHFFHLPVIQDHKRAQNDDLGPNTGGMGSYSDSNFSLPFLNEADITTAQAINEKTTQALLKKFGQPYRGVLYGGFIATAKGIKLIEYNARFGDPEAMNVLTLMENDFVSVVEAVVGGQLNKIKSQFKPLASVCKYVVPDGYPDSPVKDRLIDVSRVDEGKVDLFLAVVDQRADGLYLTGSRAAAVVACHQDLYEAERIVETEIKKIIGPVRHRSDIGTKQLISKKMAMMDGLRG